MKEQSKKRQLCVSKLKKTCQLRLIESPHHLLCISCSPQPERGLNWSLPSVKTELQLPCERDCAVLTEDAFLSAAPWQWFWFSQRIRAHRWVLGLLRWTWPAALSPPRGAAPAPAAAPGSASGPWAPSAREEASTEWSQSARLGRDTGMQQERQDKGTGNSRPGAQREALTPLFQLSRFRHWKTSAC